MVTITTMDCIVLYVFCLVRIALNQALDHFSTVFISLFYQAIITNKQQLEKKLKTSNKYLKSRPTHYIFLFKQPYYMQQDCSISGFALFWEKVKFYGSYYLAYLAFSLSSFVDLFFNLVNKYFLVPLKIVLNELFVIEWRKKFKDFLKEYSPSLVDIYMNYGIQWVFKYYY
jgi:hypothetical protein